MQVNPIVLGPSTYVLVQNGIICDVRTVTEEEHQGYPALWIEKYWAAELARPDLQLFVKVKR